MKTIAIFICSNSLLLSTVFSQTNTITLDPPISFGGNEIANLGVFGSSSAGSGHFNLNLSGNILSPSFVTVGSAFAWYIVGPSDIIDSSITTTGTEFVNNLTGTQGTIDVSVNPVFRLGVWFDESGDSSADAGDLYGWAQFEFDGSNLNLINSAVSPTQSIVTTPEPTSSVLSLMSLTALLFSRRRANA